MEILKLSTIKPFKFFVEGGMARDQYVCPIEFNVPLNSKVQANQKIKPILFWYRTEK
jgi:hypothetical protein